MKNSAPGPDGIPAAIYKLLHELFAPMILERIKELQTEDITMEEFNFSNLFIIPKSDSDIVSKTRPINVSNFDNRIVANLKVVVTMITEAVDDQQSFSGAVLDFQARWLSQGFRVTPDLGLSPMLAPTRSGRGRFACFWCNSVTFARTSEGIGATRGPD